MEDTTDFKTAIDQLDEYDAPWSPTGEESMNNLTTQLNSAFTKAEETGANAYDVLEARIQREHHCFLYLCYSYA